jgi:putative transposase
MKFAVDNIYHIYNQGNNRQVIFHNPEDYLIFLRLIRTHISPNTEIIAWCLMPNHFHFLIYADDKACVMVKQGGLEIEILTNGIRKLLSSYARIFNKRYNQTGSLFRQKTKAKNIGEEEMVVTNKYTFQDYCSNCFLYIHQNPVATGLVKVPGDWQFSSYLDYAGLRNGSLCNKALAEKYCAYNCEDFIVKTNGDTPEDF